ncbi:unnamed protein product [Sympodiomycopsis kandeliae]
MANAPDRFALFILGEGEKRVEVTEETTIENAVTVCLNKEDHTMGNMLRHAVLSVPGVLFCGYRVPHPLEPRTMLKIQTNGDLTPIQALRTGCERVIAQINHVRMSFQNEVQVQMPGIDPLTGAGAGATLGTRTGGGYYGAPTRYSGAAGGQQGGGAAAGPDSYVDI